MLGNQLPDSGNQRVWDFHNCLIGILESSLVFGNRSFFGLLLVTCENRIPAACLLSVLFLCSAVPRPL
jgi:hypothetical protein